MKGGSAKLLPSKPTSPPTTHTNNKMDCIYYTSLCPRHAAVESQTEKKNQPILRQRHSPISSHPSHALFTQTTTDCTDRAGSAHLILDNFSLCLQVLVLLTILGHTPPSFHQQTFAWIRVTCQCPVRVSIAILCADSHQQWRAGTNRHFHLM